MTNNELIAGYMQHIRALNWTKPSIRQVHIELRAVARRGPLASATETDIEDWLNSLSIAARTRAVYIGRLASFYRWAVNRGLVAHDPTIRIPRPKVPQLLPRPIAHRDLASALAQADPRMRLWLILASFQGLRCAEVAGLRADDILSTGRPPLLRVLGKGRKERLVPMGAETERALRCFGVPRRGPLFPNPRTGLALQPRTVSETIAEFYRSVGVNATAHSGRHFFGTEVYRRTRDLRMVQELLGHAQPSTTAGYTKFTPSVEMVNVVRGLSVQPPGP